MQQPCFLKYKTHAKRAAQHLTRNSSILTYFSDVTSTTCAAESCCLIACVSSLISHTPQGRSDGIHHRLVWPQIYLEGPAHETHDNIAIHLHFRNDSFLAIWALQHSWLMHWPPTILYCHLKSLLGIFNSDAYKTQPVNTAMGSSYYCGNRCCCCQCRLKQEKNACCWFRPLTNSTYP